MDQLAKHFPNIILNQAFHPFYMFQVASLLLWSVDEYYYYAVCIFLISVFSIATTVLETRSVCYYAYSRLELQRLTWIQTMRRLREISLFDCDVRVLRNGFCKSTQSFCDTLGSCSSKSLP